MECHFIPGECMFRVYVNGTCEPVYLVDLEEYRGNGSCGCENFEKVRFPTLRTQGRIIDDKERGTRCKHIHAAREFVATQRFSWLVTTLAPKTIMDELIRRRRKELSAKEKAVRETEIREAYLRADSYADEEVRRQGKGVEGRESRVYVLHLDSARAEA